MRTDTRARIAAWTVALTVLLGGCGSAASPPVAEQPTGAASPSAPVRPSTAPGVDDRADPARVFSEAELKAALLPAAAFGDRAKVSETNLGLFGRFGGGDWSQCPAGGDLFEELHAFEGASAQQTVPLTPAVEDGPVVTVQLVSMRTGRAERYLDIRRRLHAACPEVTVDTDAALVQEHHEAREVARLGDEALLEISRITGGDEYDGTPSYTVDVRVGGVLAIVQAGGDRNLGVSVAARAAQRIRGDLYGADGAAGQGSA